MIAMTIPALNMNNDSGLEDKGHTNSGNVGMRL